MKIIGLDVGGSSVVACPVEKMPRSVRRFFDENKHQIPTFHATTEGIAGLLALQPDICVMEPTGVHYSEFWYKALTHAGVKVLWVGHVQVRNYRKSERLPDKNDKADALALACYCLLHLEEPEFFLRFQPYPVDHLRRLCLQLQHLNRIQNPIVSCTRQYLAHEFPEAANRQSARKKPGDLPPLWGWLAELRPSPFYDRLWSNSVARDFGLEISDFTRLQSKRICEIERHQDAIEQELQQLLALPVFANYLTVFDEFGFGLRIRSLLLSHIYPISDFLGSDGLPLIEFTPSDAGKLQKRDRSLRAFKLRLGYGLVEDSSGKSTRWIPGGSGLCRKALWQWCLTKIEPRNSRVSTEVGQILGNYIDRLKAGGTPGKVAQSRCCAKAATMLFKKLVRQIT